MAFDGNQDQTEKIKVFVSYSRSDTVFSLDLVAGLQACGFEAFIDQEDIAPGEPWEDRLRGLIESADTMVYVLSPDSLASTHCSWEVEEALRLNKRLLPVVWREVDDASVPKTLSQLNYTFFSGKNSYAEGLRELSQALQVDHVWIRDHTRIGALARRWSARGRSDALLLRGEELEYATIWAARRPRGAPELSDDQIDFVSVSSAAHEAAERAARNRRRGLLLSVSAVAVAMTGLAIAAAVQWRQAEQARVDLAVTNDDLNAANLRLSSDIALRAPPTGTAPFEARGGWFPVAANYAGAVVRLQRRESQHRQIVTGFLIDGRVVHPAMAGEPLLLSPHFKSEDALTEENARLDEFLAATDAADAEEAAAFEGENFSRAFINDTDLDSDIDTSEDPFILEQRYLADDDLVPMFEEPPAGSDLDIMEQRMVTEALSDDADDGLIRVSFPTLNTQTSFILEGDPIWRTPIEIAAEPPFYLYRLSFEAPFGTRAIQPNDFDCDLQKDVSEVGDRYALFGIDGQAAKTEATEQLTLLVTEGLDLYDSGAITYRHATLKGAFGAPVFDLNTGKVIGIHQGVIANQFGPDGRVGFAEPLLPLINRIRDQVSIDRRDSDRTTPLCDRLEPS